MSGFLGEIKIWKRLERGPEEEVKRGLLKSVKKLEKFKEERKGEIPAKNLIVDTILGTPSAKERFWEAIRENERMPSPRNAVEQSISWNAGLAPLRGKIFDGFEALASFFAPIESLNEKGSFSFGRGAAEVLVVDRKRDKHLVELSQWAKKLPNRYSDQQEVIFHLAQKVYREMGGYDYGKAELEDYKRAMEKKEILLTDIKFGVCRHRSLLFQVLAQEAGIDSFLKKARVRHYGISEFHAYNEVYLKNGEIIVVDLTCPPGDLDRDLFGKHFGELTYQEFEKIGFPQFGSNRLPFMAYKDIKNRFIGGRLGVDGLKKLLE